jgi:PPOX class probable F420-dependent enzyme
MADEIRMTRGQIDKFLQASRHAIVATNRSNGSVQLSPVWYLYEDDCLYMFVSVDSVKYRNLRRDPRISICFDAGHPDARAVMFYGSVQLIEKDDEWRAEKKWQVFRRYFENDEDTRSYIRKIASWGPEALILVRPDRIVGVDNND